MCFLSLVILYCFFTDGNPGDVRVISSAQSQSEIYVSWYPPSVLGTADPYLLRYTVYYTSDEFLDISTAQSVNALPRLLNGVSYEGIGEFVLKNLTAGKTYSVSVVANTLMSAPKSDVKFIAVASTYGNGMKSVDVLCSRAVTLSGLFLINPLVHFYIPSVSYNMTSLLSEHLWCVMQVQVHIASYILHMYSWGHVTS